MPTRKQMHIVWESEMEFPETRREDDPMYRRPKTMEEIFPNEEISKVQNDINDVMQASKPDLTKLSHNIDINLLRQLLHDCQQVMSGYAQDDTWSEWDEEVRKRLIDFQYKINI